ncbi:NAD(P)H-dependent oxidoreductase [Variovorax sp. WS11]|uniref:NAD(P)H-dependent oxidoreductase n=1 Tax=Variovorax sp. WS11 TaxID=1105204 RepID=UPI0013D9E4F9|nr:NAD(P)H-dependent oxidoreductase [Variovorax sp. WS11]NDZ18873.1 NAD(P)H-dependent oxidoreductase [Variovorax sp. WS11]
MKVLIVFAHPEPTSFGGSLLDRGAGALRAAGHQLEVSDLYAMGFNPVASADDFTQRRFPDALQYDREQKHASAHHAFSDDIQAEIDKLRACDMLILQFPLWWFSMPAIMKGWIDRVFVNGLVYGSGRRFDAGGMKGRRAMVSITTACYPGMVEHDGLLAHLDINLWHLQHGTLAYAGFGVLAPFAAWSIHYTTPEKRAEYLDDYAARLTGIEGESPMPMHPLEDFGKDWRLKPGIAPRTIGHRRALEQAR